MAESVFKWVKTNELMIAVNTAGNISDHLWTKFMDDFGADDFRAYLGCSLGILEVTSIQRKAAASAIRSNRISISIVTDDVLVRGVVTAVSWLGAKIKSHPWSDLDTALERLEVGARKPEIMAALDELRGEVEAEFEERRRVRLIERERKRRSS